MDGDDDPVETTPMRAAGVVGTAAMIVLLAVASPAMAVTSFFDVVSDTDIVAGPPYPTACHRTDVAHESSGVFERDGQLALGIRRAADGEGNHIGSDLRPCGEQALNEEFWEHTHFDLMYCPDPDGNPCPEEKTVTFLVELTAFGGRPGKLIALHPEVHVTDPLRFFDSFSTAQSLNVVCQVEFDRGVLHELTLHADLPEGTTLSGARLTVREQTLESSGRADVDLVDSYFTANPDACFDVRLSVEGGTHPDDVEPIMSLTFSGRFLGGISPVEDMTWGAIKAIFAE